MVGAALFLFGFFDFLPHLPDFLLGRFCKLCHFILKLADVIEIYADVLDCVSRPFLVALMHFNPAEKLGRIYEPKEETTVVYPTAFHVIEGREEFDDPFAQAEHAYSLIETEVNKNGSK